MIRLTQEARERLEWAINKGLEIRDTEADILVILEEQEIVSYSRREGTVSFDQQDIEYRKVY